VLDRATVTLGPNASQQVSLHASSPSCTPPQNTTPAWVNHVVITVSQPSLSYVASVVNGETPRVLLKVQ
jgi:hypothetical protein